MNENAFQKWVIKQLKEEFKGCMVLKNDSNYIQGIPDLLVLYKNRWAALEVKKNKSSKKRPNQKYYVSRMNRMSFAEFIFPENAEDVFLRLKKFFKK